MSAKLQAFYVVCAYHRPGFEENTFSPIRELFVASEPDFWEYQKPGTLLAYFLKRNNGQVRAEQLVSRVEQFKKTSSAFLAIGCAKTEGPLIADLSFLGKVKSSPLGTSVSHAVESARRQSLKGVTG